MEIKEYKCVEPGKIVADNGNHYITMPSFVQDDNFVKAYKLHNNDIIDYNLDEFLKPCNINTMMKYFRVIGYGQCKDYWIVKLFGKYRKICKPFKYIKCIKLEFIGE